MGWLFLVPCKGLSLTRRWFYLVLINQVIGSYTMASIRNFMLESMRKGDQQ